MRSRSASHHAGNEGGFTLIELLVVMIIIGVLAAIAIPAFLSQKKKSYEASEKSDLRVIALEISTQQIDRPTALTISGTGTVVVTATGGGTPGMIPLSPGNQLITPSAANQPALLLDGTFKYCVSLTNAKAGSNWMVSSVGGSAAQQLAAGTCP